MMDPEVGTKQCPIHFDHESEDHATAWPDDYHALRESCPVAWSDQHGGYWLATGYHDVVQMAKDDATFSSFKQIDYVAGTASGGIKIPATPLARGLPVEVDRPEAPAYRSMINDFFAPRATEGRRELAGRFANALLNRAIERGSIDLINEFTGPLPALTTMHMMGLPLEEWVDFAYPIHAIAYSPRHSPEYLKAATAVGEVLQRCLTELRAYREKPEEDNLLSRFAHRKVWDRYLTDEEILGFCQNIIAGGVDTTTALTSHALIYFHDHVEARDGLLDDAKALAKAREEFVRFVTPIHSLARTVKRDTTLGSAQMEAGDRVLLAWAAANRDSKIFRNPDEIDLHRSPNPHVGFGAGMHLCIGAFMARMMFEEMIRAVFTRIPDYRIDRDSVGRYESIGTINGLIAMPATFTPGDKVEVGIDLDTLGALGVQRLAEHGDGTAPAEWLRPADV